MTETADILVAGVGGCGASALYHLARRGVHVIGIDRFDPGHDRGSSHGGTRVIRQAYFEHPDYVPLLRRAYSLWRELEADSESHLMELCGLALFGPPGGEVIGGARKASEQYGAPLESVAARDVAEHFPALRVPEHLDAVWEPLGGYLHVEKCVRAYASRAVHYGAELRTGETILSFHATPAGVRVETDLEHYEAGQLILCPGAWAPDLLATLATGAGMEVLRKVLLWYPGRASNPLPDHTFVFELANGVFYGFPSIDGSTIKLAEHSGGEPTLRPLEVDRSLRTRDRQGVERFVTECLPGLVPRPTRHEVCLYTMTRDGHFIVDRHPEHGNVHIAAGFSGHGFKFMSALGAALAELAVDGETDAPIDFLAFDRFSL